MRTSQSSQEIRVRFYRKWAVLTALLLTGSALAGCSGGTAAPTPPPAVAPIKAVPPTSPAQAAPPETKSTTAAIPAERREKVLADAKKVAALDVQIQSLSQQANEIFTTYYGLNDAKGVSLMEALFNDAMLVMDKIDFSVKVNLAPEVLPYQDTLAVDATNKVNRISKRIDALNGDKKAAEVAWQAPQQETADMMKNAAAQKAMATALGVTVDQLTGR